jgi:hypothetical protein
VFGDNVISGGRFSVCAIFRLMSVSRYCNVQSVNVFSLLFFDGKNEIYNCYVEIVQNTVYISKLNIVYQ